MSKENNTITLHGSDYTMKVGMKAIVVFEAITEKAFEIKTQTDILAYIYAAILAGTPGTKLGFDDMLDAFDDDPEALKAAIAIAVPESAMEKLVKAYIDAKEKNEGIETKYLNKLLKVLPAEKVARYYVAEEKFRHQQIGRLGNGHFPNLRMSEEQRQQWKERGEQMREQFRNWTGQNQKKDNE